VPHTRDVEALVASIAGTCERWLARRGFGVEEAVQDDGSDAQAALQQAALLGIAALGARAGRRVRRQQQLGGRQRPLPPRCGGHGGYNLHAGVSFRASDRAGLERLCRYILRPPLAASRIEQLDDEHVRIALKRPWSDGSTSMVLSNLELAERLAALVPPARAHYTLYRGVLAAHAALRKRIIPRPPHPRSRRPKLCRTGRASTNQLGWADLLQRVFSVDGWRCACGRRMELRAIVVRPPASVRVLRGLLRARGPP
jgi:hypothetical protein